MPCKRGIPILQRATSSLFPPTIFFAHFQLDVRKTENSLLKICLYQDFLFPLQMQASFPSNERRKAHSLMGCLKAVHKEMFSDVCNTELMGTDAFK